MKKILKVLLMIPLILMSTGCPLSLTEPIDQPSIKVDDSWLGNYYGVLPTDYMWSSYSNWVVTKSTDYVYKITGKDGATTKRPEEMEKDKRMGINNTTTESSYTAHVSIIKDKQYLNVFDTFGSYYFFKIETNSNGFLLKEININLATTVTSVEDLRKTLSNNTNDDELYGASFTFEKK